MIKSVGLLRILRVIALGIALAGAIDPAITTNRTAKPEIAIVAADAIHDSALVARVARTLGSGFTVTTAPLAGADATVLVGDRLPQGRNDFATPIVAVTSDRSGGAVTIESLSAPAATPLDARVVVSAKAHVAQGGGRKVEFTLRSGDVVIDRTERNAASDDEIIPVSLTFTPTNIGAAPLRLTATLKGNTSSNSTAADFAIDVRDQRWPVLFFDGRPSWQSTFVRRAVEADDRFVVTSRVVTSKNISTDAGAPPSSLDDIGGVGRFDAVIVGAPEALTDRDVAGLETFMRRRGGSVVFLIDQRAPGPYQRLTNSSTWRDNGSGRIEAIGDKDAGLKASELAWPIRLPDGATVIAFNAPVKSDTTPRVPVIWQLPVGAGHLIVSGALDAWRFRDPGTSSFDAFWRTLIAEAANGAAAPVAISLSHSIVVADEFTDVAVTVRDAALQSLPARTTISATLQSSDQKLSMPIRLWPSGAAGELRGTVRAPAQVGAYRIVVSADGHRADAPLVVASRVTRLVPDDRDLVAAWVGGHGGTAISGDHLQLLPGALRSAIHAIPRATRWYPMRSFWWFVPFVLCLSAEWYGRRRRGLA